MSDFFRGGTVNIRQLAQLINGITLLELLMGNSVGFTKIRGITGLIDNEDTVLALLVLWVFCSHW